VAVVSENETILMAVCSITPVPRKLLITAMAAMRKPFLAGIGAPAAGPGGLTEFQPERILMAVEN
jgi:hypothetical protein